ncbi:32757_t:CDS:1, partial [Racocetra persica]
TLILYNELYEFDTILLSWNQIVAAMLPHPKVIERNITSKWQNYLYWRCILGQSWKPDKFNHHD